MATESLKARILKYFKAHPNAWIAGAQIEDLTEKNTSYVASNASRQCRQLHADGILEREMRPGKKGNIKLAFYRYVPKPAAYTYRETPSGMKEIPSEETKLKLLGDEENRKQIKWFHDLESK